MAPRATTATPMPIAVFTPPLSPRRLRRGTVRARAASLASWANADIRLPAGLLADRRLFLRVLVLKSFLLRLAQRLEPGRLVHSLPQLLHRDPRQHGNQAQQDQRGGPPGQP